MKIFYLFTPKLLVFAHVFLITLSNILVQYPFQIFGFHTTYGAFTYPLIFVLTDLTTRLRNPQRARRVIFISMLPGLIISYGIASYLSVLDTPNWANLFVRHYMPLRIALACFLAYVVGQIMDIYIFQRFRRNKSWWLAPAISTTVGNMVDTLLFFSVAFYHCTNPFLTEFWPEIALVDAGFKILITLMAFIPIYGIVLQVVGTRIRNKIAV